MSATGALRPAAEGSCAAEQERIDITAEVAQAEVVVAEPVSPGDVSVEGGYRKVRSGAPVSRARALAGCPNNTIGRSKKMVSACQPGRPVQRPCMLLLCVPHPLARFGLVTLHSPEEEIFYGRTLEEALAWCLVWLMAPEIGVGPFLASHALKY